MFLRVRGEDTVRIPPYLLGEDFDRVLAVMAKMRLEGSVQALDMEDIEEEERKVLLVQLLDLEPVGDPFLVHGDGAVYQRVRYEALAFSVRREEVVEGEVVEITKRGRFQGAIVRIGPLNAYLSSSNILDDRLNIDVKGQMIVGRETKKVLKKDDQVRARVVYVKIDESRPYRSVVGLDMRTPGLGALKWLQEERRKKK
ncbi:MAG: DNA-directed RNA polymerase [Thermoplasmata archaeon]|nr:DNA-directed RNA polymerase [Thermoplasmata archaeon]